MKKVKITILQTTFNRELAEIYGAKGLGPCPMMKEGQVFYADYAKPDGFCDEAWKAVYQYIFALAHGAGNDTFYYGDWIRVGGDVVHHFVAAGIADLIDRALERRSRRSTCDLIVLGGVLHHLDLPGDGGVFPNVIKLGIRRR